VREIVLLSPKDGVKASLSMLVVTSSLERCDVTGMVGLVTVATTMGALSRIKNYLKNPNKTYDRTKSPPVGASLSRN
jgi:hypothetical protein